MKTMKFSDKQLNMIEASLRLRVESHEDNDEIIEAKEWQAILIKLQTVRNFGGTISIEKPS